MSPRVLFRYVRFFTPHQGKKTKGEGCHNQLKLNILIEQLLEVLKMFNHLFEPGLLHRIRKSPDYSNLADVGDELLFSRFSVDKDIPEQLFQRVAQSDLTFPVQPLLPGGNQVCQRPGRTGQQGTSIPPFKW